MRLALLLLSLLPFAACRGPELVDVPDSGGGGANTDAGPQDAGPLGVDAGPMASWRQVLRIKTSAPMQSDYLGYCAAMSASGATLVLGAPHYSSSTSKPRASGGRVYVLDESDAGWAVRELAATPTLPFGGFGRDVAVSGTGDVVLAAAPFADAGVVGVFVRQGTGFAQAALVAEPTAGELGCSLTASFDGTVLAAGSCTADGERGAVFIYERSGLSVQLRQRLARPGAAAGEQFGTDVALSGDGSLLVVGAPRASAGTVSEAGTVHVFRRATPASDFVHVVQLQASNPGAQDWLGEAVAVSRDGQRIAAGAVYEESAARGVNGVQSDNSLYEAGAVYVWRYDGTTWSQEAYVKASNTNEGDYFGADVALSADGTRLLVGAGGEMSLSPGINGDEGDNDGPFAGAAYEFVFEDGAWAQRTYMKNDRPRETDTFGLAVALSDDGARALVGAWGEAEGARGLNPPPGPINNWQSGAGFLFQRE